VHEFVLDDRIGQFVLRGESLMVPEGKVYGSGGLNSHWLPEHRQFIRELEKKDYKLRYSGSLVADFNQVLHCGGVICYPATSKDPDGKLRLLFEANPLGFICEQAGGKTLNGHHSVLDSKPLSVDQRTPLFLGDKRTIEMAEAAYRAGR
jgi:fructose-1,6-bisphosphatase I